MRPAPLRARTPGVLAAFSMLFLLAAAPCAQEAGQRPPAPTMKKMQAPADPADVKGSFSIGDERIVVTEGRIWDVYKILAPHEDRPQAPLQPDQVLNKLMLHAEAAAMGCEPTPEELEALNPLQRGKDEAAQWRDRFEALGIGWPEYREYLRMTLAIQRMEDLFANSSRVLSPEVYEAWKKEHYLFTVDYVPFSAEAFAKRYAENPPTEKQLKEFWSTNAEVKNRYRKRNSVSADIVVLDVSKVPEEEIKAALGDRKIPYEEALSFFQANRDRLQAMIPSEKRPLLYPRDKVPLEEIVTPFELLEDHIHREMILGDRIRRCFEEARQQGVEFDPRGLARKYGLTYVEVDEKDNIALSREYAQFGPQLFTTLFNAKIGSFSPEVQVNRDLHYFWRLRDKRISSLPEYEEIKDKLPEEYVAHHAYTDAHAEAKEMMDWIQAKVNEDAADELAALDQAREKEIEQLVEEAKTRGEDGDRARNTVAMRVRAQTEAKKRKLKATLEPGYFDQYVKEKGVEVLDYGPFEFTGVVQDRREITDPKEKLESFLSSHYPIRTMEPGQISQVLSDVITQTHVVVRLAKKEEPPFEHMSAADYQQRMLRLEQTQSFAMVYRWSPYEVKRRLGWTDKN